MVAMVALLPVHVLKKTRLTGNNMSRLHASSKPMHSRPGPTAHNFIRLTTAALQGRLWAALVVVAVATAGIKNFLFYIEPRRNPVGLFLLAKIK
jgi:hypothetical protein